METTSCVPKERFSEDVPSTGGIEAISMWLVRRIASDVL